MAKRAVLTKRICNRCGAENAPRASTCSSCNSTRFAPKWVLAKRPINRQVGVEVTESDASYGEVTKRVTLSKWWPGGRSSFHIPNLTQWNEIQRIINDDLGPLLGWRSKKELIEAVRAGERNDRKADKEIKTLVQEHPDVLRKIVQALDPKKLALADMDDVLKVMNQVIDAFRTVDTGFKAAFLHLVSRLPKERKQALEQLEDLLGKWSLQQIASVAQQVKARLDTIELFKKQIMDDRTYEIRGDKSIHRILEGAMWLVDERYWLLQSNETLLHFIGDAMAKKDKARYGTKRPDFLCGTVGDKLIIIEIKRPAHLLTIEDMNQLETYVTMAEEYSSFSSCEAYLVGRRVSDDLTKRMKHRSRAFKVWTYSDLVSGAESRYRGYLKTA